MAALIFEPDDRGHDPWADMHNLAARQAGVISRRQALRCGITVSMLQHQLRTRRWQRLQVGVYATFSGVCPRGALVWAAVLAGDPDAAVSHCCALVQWGMRLNNHHDDSIVHLSVDGSRRVQNHRGVVPHRVTGLAGIVHPARRPPVIRFEHAVLQQASVNGESQAIAVIADACQQRLTTPARLRLALTAFPKLRLRATISSLLTDVASGAYSYLEMEYLRKVERPHGLPTGSRQHRIVVGARPFYRDVEYLGLATIIELDGRLGHEDFAGRANDYERDLNTAATGSTTARLGHAQVFGDPCRTAAAIGRLLLRNGWTGAVRPCGPNCAIS